MAFKTYAEWRYEVDRQFRVRTGNSLKTLKVTEKLLKSVFKLGRPPQEFVADHIARYKLLDRSKTRKDWYQ